MSELNDTENTIHTCKLCLAAPANQTGSHLFSAFLVQSMIGKRDHEKGYEITGSASLDYRQNKMADPIKEDYILCRGCEQRLSFVESYISSEYTKKVFEAPFATNFPIKATDHGNTYVECQRVDSLAFSILIYSIIWRGSISKNQLFSRFALSDATQDRLRSLMDSLLPKYKNHKVKESSKVWIKQLELEQYKHHWPKYLLLTEAGRRTGVPNRNMIFAHPKAKDPFLLLFNDYLLLFFPEELTQINLDYFQVESIFPDWRDVLNVRGKFKIGQIEATHWDGFLEKLKNELEAQKIAALRSAATTFFIKEFGETPTEEEINEMVIAAIRNSPTDLDESRKDVTRTDLDS